MLCASFLTFQRFEISSEFKSSNYINLGNIKMHGLLAKNRLEPDEIDFPVDENMLEKPRYTGSLEQNGKRKTTRGRLE